MTYIDWTLAFLSIATVMNSVSILLLFNRA